MAGSAFRISVMRSMAPAVFCTSPHTSPSAPTAPAASTDRMTNWIRVPPLMVCRVNTAWAAHHMTRPMPPATRIITKPVINARAPIRRTDAR
jgi:hypothetical protein